MAKITNLGHACFLLESSDYSVVVDPYQDDSVPNMRLPRGLKANEVFCSHDHYDHNAKEMVEIIPSNKRIEVVSVTVPHDDEGGRKRGLNEARLFNLDGYKVVHLGDIGCVVNEKTLKPFKGCDILLAPINGFFTIGPKALKELCAIIKPRIVIPIHYFMDEYQSGYPDGDMITEFKKLFPDYQFIEKDYLDLDEYKDYQGSLIFKKYRQ